MCHGLNMSIPTPAKSRTLQVASLQAGAKALANLSESNADLDLPSSVARAVMPTDTSDAERLNDQAVKPDLRGLLPLARTMW